MSEKQAITAILLLEDEGLVRVGMKLLLQQAEPGCRIDDVASFEEAVARIEKTHYDFAFVDINLRSTHTGMDLLAMLRSSMASTRVVMLSGIDDRKIILDCISAGASGYIPKATEDDVIFKKAIQTIMADGIFLPASVLGSQQRPSAPALPLNGQSARDLGLPDRMVEVLFYLCQGKPNKVIADKMGISEGTVRKNYVSALLSYFKVARRTELLLEVSRRQLRIPAPRSYRDTPLAG